MSGKDKYRAARAFLSKPMVKVGLFSILHFLVFLFVLFNSFQYVHPWEPGYDPASGRRAELFGVIVNVLAFPIVTLVFVLPCVPAMLYGPLSWLANSLLWGCGVYWISVVLRRARGRLEGRRSE